MTASAGPVHITGAGEPPTVLQRAGAWWRFSRATWRQRRRRASTVLMAALRWLWSSGTLQLVALVGAWAGIGIFIAQFFPRIWPLWIAVLCLSFVGWRYAWTVVFQGLFTLSQQQDRTR